ncbi:MAG: patatin-like phospholipase family protein [Gammaproteobacteria bacterium]|nr:patatin-like phospholipase family protein [Gammaproteobacteria bacterium]
MSERSVEFFQRASHCYGRSALMLSGGGTLGYFHLGVLKALIEQELCPTVISGASAGAFVAAIVGTRTDAEFLALFEDNYLARALTMNSGKHQARLWQKNRIDMDLVKREMQRLIPDMTFLEAFRKTGRSINITVSPASVRQTSRLLNHIASPNVTVLSAVLASSALPGVFAPVQLEARNAAGKIRPHLPSRRWIDGSFSQDLPAASAWGACTGSITSS